MPGFESDETRALLLELIIAAGLGGVYDLREPMQNEVLMQVSCSEVDTCLAAALQDETLSRAERLQLSTLRKMILRLLDLLWIIKPTMHSRRDKGKTRPDLLNPQYVGIQFPIQVHRINCKD